MYYLYVLLCCDKSLYTGITNNIPRRMLAHRSGKGSKYVNSRLPFRLIHKEKFKDKSLALRREVQIKKLSREDKIKELGVKIS
ncbi:GIY-YIG nuclease family protein [Candidatus Dojkabacteria bacterium]|nr:GIY-YIG nuclease family protein [Candidatus Dojkabacteria bacterium]